MDDVKRRISSYISTSLRLRLSLWLALAISCMAVLAGAFAFYSAFQQAHELQDDMLRQVATLASRHQLATPAEDRADDHPDNDSKVFVQQLGAQTAGGLALPADLPDGLQSVRADGETYRVMVLGGHGQRLAVAQETSVRDETARDSALLTLIPFLILVPVLLLVAADLVRKVFKPVLDAAAAVDARAEQDLQPIGSAALPSEVKPFADAINRLLARVRLAMDEQRRFIADAAHELRTPLTALSLQAERLAATSLPEEAQTRLATLRQGIERGRSLLDQLLSLARVQEPSDAAQTQAVPVRQVYRQVLEDLLPLAEAKQIDIGVIDGSDVQVIASAIDLATLVKNLLDNAIRYTPQGGRIDLSVYLRGTTGVLAVEDSGPGIAEAERSRVFDPFYRVLGSGQEGSGLGLAIVHAICTRIGGNVNLAYADTARGTGLRVEVQLLAATP